MPLAITAGLPPYFTLENNYVLRVTTQDAATGAVVSSVKVSNVSISVDQESLGPVAATPEPVTLIAGAAA